MADDPTRKMPTGAPVDPPRPSNPDDPSRTDLKISLMDQAGIQAIKELVGQLTQLSTFMAIQGRQGGASLQGQHDLISAAAGSVQQTMEVHDAPTVRLRERTDRLEREVQELRTQYSTTKQQVEEYKKRVEEGKAAQASLIHDPTGGAAYNAGVEQQLSHMNALQKLNFIQKEKQAIPEVGQQYGGAKGTIDRFLQLSLPKRYAPEDDTFEQTTRAPVYGGGSAQTGRGGGGGGPKPPSGIAPGEDNPDDNTGRVWRSNLEQHQIGPDQSIHIPRLGEWTIEDKLRLASQWIGRSAIRANDADADKGGLRGRVAGGLGYAAENAAGIYAAQNIYRKARSFSGDTVQRGVQLGFSPEAGGIGQDITVGGLGFRPPWADLPFVGSPAAQEGWRQQADIWRAQLSPGINDQQAQQMASSISGRGWSGNTFHDMMSALIPLTQQGISPDVSADVIDRSTRQGTASIDQARMALDRLGDVARKVHMTTNELASSMMEFAQAQQQTGGTFYHGIQTARDLAEGTGLPPQVFAQASQSPIYQGLAMSRYGILPQAQGTMSATGVGQTTQQAVEMAYNMFRGVNRGNEYETGPGGQRILVARGSEQQYAMVGSQLGIPPEIVKRMIEHPRLATEGPQATTIANQFLARAMHLQGRTMGGKSFETRLHPGSHSIGDAPAIAKQDYLEDVGTHDLTPAQRRALLSNSMNPNDNVWSWGELKAQMTAMDPNNANWKNRIHGLEKEGDPVERARQAKKLIDSRTNQPSNKPNQITLQLTPQASKLVEAMGPGKKRGQTIRIDMASGGNPAVQGYAGPLPPNGQNEFQALARSYYGDNGGG